MRIPLYGHLSPRGALSLVLLCALLVSTAAFGPISCNNKDKTPEQIKAEFISYAKDIAGGLRSALPLIVQHKPQLKARWEQAIAWGDKLIVAAEASNQTEALALVADLIPLVEEVADAFTDNTTVLIALGLANIGLHFFVNHWKPPATRTARVSPEARILIDFKDDPAWGCKYHPEKCKALK